MDQGAKYVTGTTHEQIRLNGSWMKALEGKHGEQRTDALLERISEVRRSEEPRLPFTDESMAPTDTATEKPADEMAVDLDLVCAMTTYGVLQ